MLASSNKTKKGGILFAGHTDTVAFEEHFWDSDPFILKEINNKLFSLGTADMKGFFAFLLDAISEINLKKLKNPLHILATADEETDMSGADFFAKNTTLKPYFTIIGEPTSLQPVIAQKGHISYAIHVYGKSGHSGNPILGINSIDIMH
jgi:acetylornithine deacetylase